MTPAEPENGSTMTAQALKIPEIPGAEKSSKKTQSATADPLPILRGWSALHSRILLGEESFVYHRLAYAGEKLLFESRIADIYEKKGGALSFLVRETRVTNSRGEHVADLRSVLVHRNG